MGRASHCAHDKRCPWMPLEGAGYLHQPVGLYSAVVVEQGHYVAVDHLEANITGVAGALLIDSSVCQLRETVGVTLHERLHAYIVTLIHHQDVPGRVRHVSKAFETPPQVIRAVAGRNEY